MTRSGRTFWIAVGAVAAFRLLVWATLMRHVPLVGDEVFYLRRSNMVANWFSGDIGTTDAIRRIVFRGWFMPGPSIVAAPVRAFTDNLGTIRLWMGLVDLAGLIAVARLASNLFGRRVGLGLLLIIGFFPDPAAQSFTLWGEAIGSKIFLLALLLVVVQVRDWSTSAAIRPVRLFAVGMLLGFAVYLRPPLLFQLGTLLLLLGLAGFGRRGGSTSGSTVAAMVLLAVGTVVVVAPWSAAVSNKTGGFVPTTLSIDVNAIHAFSNPQDLEALAGGTGFGHIHTYASDLSETNGISYAAALRTTRADLLSNVSFADYWSRADREVETFLSEDESFLKSYRSARLNGGGGTTTWLERRFFDGLLVGNKMIWYPLALAVAYAFLRNVGLSNHSGLAAIGTKVALVVFAAQPFLSNAKFRHLGVAIPTMSLLALLTLSASPLSRWGPMSGGDESGETGEISDATGYRRWALRVSGVAQLAAGLVGAVLSIVYLN